LEPAGLFPYRARPGQDSVLRDIRALASTGGSLLVDAPTGSGKTIATLAPLLEHAEAAQHKILYLVRTHAQEAQVLAEARAIARARAPKPFLSLGLAGRQRRCFLLESLAEMKGATAEEYGKLCADRKRATQKSFDEGGLLSPPPELPQEGSVDLVDLEGCPYFGRVLQADLESLAERFSTHPPTNAEYEEYCRTENLCAYELAKKLVERARLVTAPYAFFFHPHVRRSLLASMGVDLAAVDLVVDEAHNLPDYLRELGSVALPQESVRRARAEVTESGDVAVADGVTAGAFFETVLAAIDALVDDYASEDDGSLPPNAFEDELLSRLGGTSQRLDTLLGSLVAWGEAVREERRRARKLPRSAVHSVAMTLLSWPRLAPPEYAKVATREPARGLEAYALDAASAAAPVRECHLSVHLSGTLAPLEEYRDALGLGSAARLLRVPSSFPRENVRYLYDPTVTTRYEELRGDDAAIDRIARRLTEILPLLPVKTAVFFPSFRLMERVLAAGLGSTLAPGAVVETRALSTSDLWRSVEGFKHAEGGGLLLGVTGGRIAEGIDFPDEELEAVVAVGIPFPRPTAKRDALRRYLDVTTGRGWEYCVLAPAQRALLQAFGRMIRSEHDRGIAIVLDRRATQFEAALPGLAEIGDLAETVKSFFPRRPARRRAATPRATATGSRRRNA
jgi:DNA excision repair protein ERCC-2